MKRRSNRRWRRATALALAACIGAGLLVPGALAAEGDEAILIEGDPVPTEDSAYRASTYIVPSALPASAYEGLSTAEALDLARNAGDTVQTYFPVTLFDYDLPAFNNAQHQADVESVEDPTTLTEWQALYFGDGDPGTVNAEDPGYEDSGRYEYDYERAPGYYEAKPRYSALAYADTGWAATAYYVKDETSETGYTQVEVMRTSESTANYSEVWDKPDFSDTDFDRNEYYMLNDEDGQYYRITGVVERQRRDEWGIRETYYDIYGTPTGDSTYDINTAATGIQDVQSGTGLKVADIPVTSVDMGEEPTDPAESEEPTAPVEPTDPVESEEPTAPVEPTEPVESEEPTAPVEPTDPVESEEPTAPVEPTDPVESEEPTVPVEPTDPVESEEPTAPVEPTEPVESEEPTVPAGDPGMAEQPGAPEESVPPATNAIGTSDTYLGEATYHQTGLFWGSYYPEEAVYTIDGSSTEYHYYLRKVGTQGDDGYFYWDTIADTSAIYTGTGEQALYEYQKEPTHAKGTITIPYAEYNYWTGNGTKFADRYRGWVYGGLMGSDLDRSGDPQFNVPDAGIFTTDAVDGKTVYQNVGLPFIYEDGYYIFDSSRNSAIFNGAGNNMIFRNYPQENTDYGEDNVNRTGFYPFNTQETVNSGTANYHFGMRASVDFTMTADGTWNGEDIVFEFSGDDDVWVFVDGKLVLDLGGIHDKVDGTINFQTGAVTYRASAENQTSGILGPNGSRDETTDMGDLYKDFLGTNKDTFAAQDTHTLTIFYLERGAGASNCKIQFNLPQRDSLIVRKEVSDVDSEGQRLTDEQKQALEGQTYTFTVYQNGAPLSGQRYAIYNSSDVLVSSGTTTSSGSFALHDGQYAKFYGVELTEDNIYYVTEAPLEGFSDAEWELDTSNVTSGSHTTTSGTPNQSDSIEVYSGEEVSDTVQFVCTNTLEHITTVSVNPRDDVIVIDFGLPVDIDVLANDMPVAAGGTTTLTVKQDGTHGTASVVDGKIRYTLSGPMNDVDTFTYRVRVENGGDVAEGEATVTVIPATSMYYEQDFDNMITWSDGWEIASTPGDAIQQAGVPGDDDNVPYGADPYYYDQSGDSADGVASTTTTSGPKSFSYSFTGTGTAIFARLSKGTGLMYVEVTDDQDGNVYYIYRDTQILEPAETGDTIYNIPVYNIVDLDYGTYTVNVIIAQPNDEVGNQDGFYVDGIRVYDPLDPQGLAGEVEDAYQMDNEIYNKVVEIRDKLITDYSEVLENGLARWVGENEGFITLTDTDGRLDTASEYITIGPKNELYLDARQSVTFSVANFDLNNDHIFLGMKALSGTGSVTINSNDLTLRNTVDQYYDISTYGRVTSGQTGSQTYTFTITAGSGPISLTNIKVTGDADFVILENQETLVQAYQ